MTRVWRTGIGNSRYREFFIFFWWYQNWYRNKNWYRKKVSESVMEKLGTEKSFGTSNEKNWYRNWFLSQLFLGILKICNGYRYWECFLFLILSEPVSEIIGSGKSLRASIGKTWYRKKVSESVSEKYCTKKVPVLVWKIFGTGKSISISILGTVTHCPWQTWSIARFCHCSSNDCQWWWLWWLARYQGQPEHSCPHCHSFLSSWSWLCLWLWSWSWLG